MGSIIMDKSSVSLSLSGIRNKASDMAQRPSAPQLDITSDIKDIKLELDQIKRLLQSLVSEIRGTGLSVSPVKASAPISVGQQLYPSIPTYLVKPRPDM